MLYSLYLLQEGNWVMPELLTSVDELKVMKVLGQELPDLVVRSISYHHAFQDRCSYHLL